MIRLVLTILLTLVAGPAGAAKWSAVVPMYNAAGGGGGTTEYLYPDGDISIAWRETDTDSVGSNHWARLDDQAGEENTAYSDTLYAFSGNRDEYTLTNPSTMGSGDTCSQISVTILGNGHLSTCEVQVQYSLDGSSWTTISSPTLPSGPPAQNTTVTASGLALSLSDVQNLRVAVQRIDGSSCDMSNLITEITY